MPQTLWNLPSRLPCRNSKGSEACHLRSRVQSNVDDVISSEISKLGRGICKQRWSGTGLQLLVTANKLSFCKEWQASFPWQCWKRSPLHHHWVQLWFLAPLPRGRRSVTSQHNGRWQLGQCGSFGVWTPQIIYSAMGAHSEVFTPFEI